MFCSWTNFCEFAQKSSFHMRNPHKKYLDDTFIKKMKKYIHNEKFNTRIMYSY